VSFDTENDHVYTRMEHVNHVATTSGALSDAPGLNTGLVGASALGIVGESANVALKRYDSRISLA
jgi:hypothetical protein